MMTDIITTLAIAQVRADYDEISNERASLSPDIAALIDELDLYAIINIAYRRGRISTARNLIEAVAAALGTDHAEIEATAEELSTKMPYIEI